MRSFLCLITFVSLYACEKPNNQSQITMSAGETVRVNTPGFGNAFYIQVQGLGNSGIQHCSATLLSKRYFLTAAHCLGEGDSVSSFLSQGQGYFPRLDALQDGQLTYQNISFKILAHPLYRHSSFNNDIAVGYLSEESPEGYSGAEILPDSSVLLPQVPLTLVGFGRTSHTSSVAKYFYQTIRKMNGVHHTPSQNAMMSFTHFDEQFACQGDSGGPAYVEYNGTTYLAAIAEGEIGMGWCGDKNINFYTLVGSYEPWIKWAQNTLLNFYPSSMINLNDINRSADSSALFVPESELIETIPANLDDMEHLQCQLDGELPSLDNLNLDLWLSGTGMNFVLQIPLDQNFLATKQAGILYDLNFRWGDYGFFAVGEEEGLRFTLKKVAEGQMDLQVIQSPETSLENKKFNCRKL